MYIGGEKYELKNGTVVIVPAGVEYYFEREGTLRIVSINFDYTQNFRHKDAVMPPATSDVFNEAEILEQTTFENYVFLNKPLVIDNMSYLKQSIDAILEEHAYKKQFYREVASGHFRNILYEILRRTLWEEKNSKSVNLILDYIHNHYSEEINNTSLSELAGYHPYHLNRLVKKSTGTTLRQYLINYRIEMAKRFLRETDLRISTISERCGYKSFSNFSEDFKKKTGMPPIKYRAALQHLM
jgi:AraC-like DNA-binding protein